MEVEEALRKQLIIPDETKSLDEIKKAKRNFNLSITVGMLLCGFFFIMIDVCTNEPNTFWGWLGVILVGISFIQLTIRDLEDRKKEREV